jgi:hypothetical protein
MALIRWTSHLDQPSICDAIAQAIAGCGLPVDYSRCTREQFFAVIPRAPERNRAVNVNVLAVWTDPSHRQIEMEVSSDESLLSHTHVCADVSGMLLQCIPRFD